MAISLACITVIMQDIYYKAQVIANKIASGEIPFDPLVISEQIDATAGTIDSSITTAIYLILMAVWLVGIVDSYRLAKKIDPSFH